jgi:hypothetical protein
MIIRITYKNKFYENPENFYQLHFMVLVFEQLHSLKKMVGGYNNVLKKYC